MNTSTICGLLGAMQPSITHSPSAEDPYATESQTEALIQRGADYRRDRLAAKDMLTTDEAAAIAGTTRVSINLWIKKGRCIGLTQMRRGYKLPRWQFEPTIFNTIEPICRALGTNDGWQVLSFYETPHPAIGDTTPRLALERGIDPQRIIDLASAQGH